MWRLVLFAPPPSPHPSPLSLLCEHFKNVSSEHPSLSCLKKTRRDCRHGVFLTWFFLGGEISKVVFLFLRHLIFLSCWTLPKNPTTLLIYSVLFHALSEQIIPSRKLAVSDHLSARVAQGAEQAGLGWLSAGPSSREESLPDAATEVHARLGLMWVMWRMSTSWGSPLACSHR